jgi:hypothetical protein
MASTFTSLSSHEAATRLALGAAALRLQLVLVHRSQVHLQRRAPRASASGNAHRAPCTHNAARQRGAQVARQRGAARAQPQSRVLHSAENVCGAPAQLRRCVALRPRRSGAAATRRDRTSGTSCVHLTLLTPQPCGDDLPLPMLQPCSP